MLSHRSQSKAVSAWSERLGCPVTRSKPFVAGYVWRDYTPAGLGTPLTTQHDSATKKLAQLLACKCSLCVLKVP